MKFSLALVAIGAFLYAQQALAAAPSCYSKGHSTFTNYWVSKEGTTDMDNDGNIVHLSGPKTHPLKSGGKVIAKVDKNTFFKCQMEGTCLLSNGLMVNLNEPPNNFDVLNRRRDPYGLGATDSYSLSPYVSVAANDLKLGTRIFIKELKGKRLPNGLIHNGCVRVDDRSWSFGSCHLDYFVLQYDSYLKLKTPDHVHAVVENCQIKNYITKSILEWGLLTHSHTPKRKPKKITKKKTKKTKKPSSHAHSCRTNDDCPGITCCSKSGHHCTNDNAAGTICM